MRTGIDRIAEKARKEKTFVFTSLTHHITPELLGESLYKIPISSGTGVDGESVQEAKEGFDKWSAEMITAVHRRGYRPPPTRRTYIPKIGKKEMRPIAMPTTKDKVLQKATVKVLNAIYEQDFLKCSFGGREKRSAHQALATLHTAISTRKVRWVYEADLKNFFGSLNHEWVKRFISHRVQDPRIITLINRWLKAGVMEEGEYQQTREGTPQGGPISVLISNVYLHYVLDLWIEKAIKPRMKGEMYYYRYLDDFVIGFQYHADAARFQQVIEKRLEKFSLELELSKTRLVEFGRFAEKSAKAKGKKLKTIYFLGFTLYCTKNRNSGYKLGMKTEKKRLRRSYAKMKLLLRKIRHRKLQEQKAEIEKMLRGHYRYYGVGGNISALYALYRHTIKYWRKSLSSRSQKGKLNWSKYKKILEKFPPIKPRLFLPYSEITKLGTL